MKIRVGHLYPDYLNIYADRGNIAVLARRAAWRGHELDVAASRSATRVRPGAHDLLYVGGGQDREQALVARRPRRARPTRCTRRSTSGAAVLAVCGGYQLLGRYYRDRDGVELPGVGLLPLHTIAGERRMIGDVLLECELGPGRDARRLREPRRPDAPRRGAEPLGRVVHGFGNDGESGFEGCRAGRAIGTYLHGPLLPRNPWLADWLLAQALAHATRRRAAGARAAAGRARAGGARRRGRPRARARRPFLAVACTSSSTAPASSSTTSRRSTSRARHRALVSGAAPRRAHEGVAEHHRRRVSRHAGALAQRARRVPRRRRPERDRARRAAVTC